MRYIVQKAKRFCGFITGIVFFIGGLLKLMDPVGAALVMDEYFSFLHVGFLSPAAKASGVLFAFAEAIIGTALITGVWRKTTGIAAIAFQGFFTLLTLLLVIFNPEMDCGCFGEAIHLTHMQTFLKNIVLLLLLAAYFFPASQLGRNLPKKYVSFGIVVMSVTAFTLYSLRYIPVVDFTDYKTGATLASAEHEHHEEAYESVFIYEKNGRQEEFRLDNLPDSTWTFVSTETVAVNGSDADKNMTLSFYDTSGEYHDELAAKGKVMVVSLYDTDISKREWERISRFTANAAEAGIRPIVLAAATADQIKKVTEEHGISLEDIIYLCDYKTLITLNRSNGGASFFSDGFLAEKWASCNLPDEKKLKKLNNDDYMETYLAHDTQGSLIFQGFLLYVFAIMLLL